MKRPLKAWEEAQVIGHSAVMFFTIFVLIYVLPDEHFRRRAKALLIVFTVTRVIIKFSIFIPYKEQLAAERSNVMMTTRDNVQRK